MREEPVGAAPDDGVGDPAELADEREILRPGQVGVEDGLLGDVANLRLVSQQIVADVLAVVEHGAARRLQQAGDDGDRRGLARAVGSEDAEDAARGDVEADVPDRGNGRVVLRQAARLEHGLSDTGSLGRVQGDFARPEGRPYESRVPSPEPRDPRRRPDLQVGRLSRVSQWAHHVQRRVERSLLDPLGHSAVRVACHRARHFGARDRTAVEPADDRVGAFFTGALDLQMLVGLIMYFALSPITREGCGTSAPPWRTPACASGPWSTRSGC